MKIKELQKTVNVTWSPNQQNPILLAAGTSAAQLDASFSTNATLDVYSLNLADPGYEMLLKGSIKSAHRFNKLAWSSNGVGATHFNGLIVGACENGVLQVFSASKLLHSEEALVAQESKHVGPVHCVDVNQFQANLIATGSTDSEIFIWDLNNTKVPMSPGTKIQPFEDVVGIHWNKQVQHILASVQSSRCVIWDLRKNEPIIKLHDTQSRVRWRPAQWHPEVATQIWLASEEDSAPTVQLWDLRFATGPSKTLQIHQRGVLGLTWCPQDLDFMISCGKDNKILCWNPNSESQEGEILSEIATTSQWSFDVSWCPRNPALISSCSFDGTVSIHSIFGGSVSQSQTTSKIKDSFPGMDNAQVPVPQNTAQHVANDPTKPPKWLRRPCGVKFGFGGKLISFNQTDRKITVSQVVTDMELVERSTQLEEALAQGNFIDFCRQKADQSNDQHERYLWYFIKANFEQNPRTEMLNLLGYQPEDIAAKFSQYIKKDESIDSLTNQLNESNLDGEATFDNIGQQQQQQRQQQSKTKCGPYKLRTGTDSEGLICEALLTGNIEAAVELCMTAGRSTDAIILAMFGGADLLGRTQYRYLRDNDSYVSNIISALVTRDWNDMVSKCTIDSWKEALVAILTHGNEELSYLCERLGERLRSESAADIEMSKNAILCYICSGSLEPLVETWSAVQASKAGSPNKQTKNIQELVEVIMVLQKAAEIRGKSIDISGRVADILSQYASYLAAQGSLASALTYLGPSLDPDLVELKDRLYHALGHKQISQQRQSNAYATPVTTNRYAQPRTSISASVPQQLTPGGAVPGSSPYFSPQPLLTATPGSWNSNPVQSSPYNNTVTQPPLNPPTMLGPPPLDVQPPRPPSVNSQHGGTSGPLTSRAKYVLDPSVRSGPSYGQTGASNMYSGVNDYGANNVTSPFAGPIPPTPQYNQFNTNPVTTGPGNQFQPFTPTSPQMGGAMPPASMPPVADLNQPGFIQPQKNPTPPPGWNDPPPMTGRKSRNQTMSSRISGEMSAVHSGTRRWGKIISSHHAHGVMGSVDESRLISSTDNNQKQEVAPAVAPITHPLFGVDPNQQQQQQQQQQTNGFHQQDPYNQAAVPPAANFYNPLQQQQQPGNQQSIQPPAAGFQQNFQAFSPQQQPAPVQPANTYTAARATPEPPKPKAPLPEEFIYLQTVLDELRKQCINSANNPQTKRKLDDVAKRLEQLYDLLRENRLSQNTLAQLNQLVQLIQIGDYANAIGLHSHMASGPDFATIASFMPGVKVLLQSAMQLQVYLR